MAMRTTISSPLDRIPEAVQEYILRRGVEILGLLLASLVTALALSLATWSAHDPSLNYAADGPIKNILGSPGALVSDVLIQMLGVSSIILLVPLAFWSWTLVRQHSLPSLGTRIFLLVCGIACSAALASLLPATGRWPLPTGLGGVLGDALLILPRRLTGDSSLGSVAAALMFGFGAVISLTGAASFSRQVEDDSPSEPTTGRRSRAHAEDEDRVSDPGLGLVLIGAVAHVFLSARSRLKRLFAGRDKKAWEKEDQLWGAADEHPASAAGSARRTALETPVLRAEPPPRPPAPAKPIIAEPGYAESEARRVAPPPAPIKAGRRAERERNPRFLAALHTSCRRSRSSRSRRKAP